jgi:hypothetical protein
VTRRPIRAAYEANGALRRDCPQCDAGPGQWCIDPRGRLRRVPCVLRTRSEVVDTMDVTFGSEPDSRSTTAVDFSEPRRSQGP